MKRQIISVFIVAILLTGLISLTLFIRRERQIELHWLTEGSRSQLDLVGDLILGDIEKMKGQIARVATFVEAGQMEEAQKNLGAFVGMAAIDPETTNFLWKIQAQSSNSSQKDEWSAQWIQKLRETTATEGELKFYAVPALDNDVRSAIALMANVRDRKTNEMRKVKLIGVLSKVMFQDLLDKLKVQGAHVFLVAASGMTLAHTVSEYVGNSMSGDRIYEEIRTQKNTFGSVVTKDHRGEEVLSFYLKVPEGKLTLVSQWRKDLWINTDWGFYGQGLLVLLAVALFGGALVQFLVQRLQTTVIREVPVEKVVEKIVEKVIERPLPMAPANAVLPKMPLVEKALPSETPSIPARPPAVFNTSMTPERGREPQVPMRILIKVVDALRAPLLSVLGHVQIARLNPQGGSLQAIETEIRNVRDVLDKVAQYSGQAQVPSVTLPLFELVESSLRTLEGTLLRGGIKLVREIPADLAIKCDMDDFRNALSALFRNSIEAMEKSPRKVLTLRASKQNNMVVFEIEDTGMGIDAMDLPNIFEPFYSTRSPLDHRGLGLAMANGIFIQHDGDLQVRSKVGEGTTMILKIPASQEVVQSLSELGIPQRPIRELKTPSMEALADQDTETSTVGSAKDKIEVATQSKGVVSTDLRNSFDLFDDDDDDSIGEFQFGRLNFVEPTESESEKTSNLSRGEQMALEVQRSMEAQPSSSPSKRLKKKEEPLAKMKVQIPRPEERS